VRQLGQHVAQAYDEHGLRTLLVTSTLFGEGKSHIALALAKALNELRFSVLLIESVEPKNVTVIPTKNSDERTPRKGMLVAEPARIPEITTNRNLSRMHVDDRGLSPLKHAEQLVEIAQRMRDQFDLVLIDGWALSSCPESRIMISRIDDTVLVIEAERTSCDVAALSISSIDEAGGRLLGIVLNKRRQVIPPWIYDRWLAGDGGMAHE
jgi:Mrp family chromosome partitioning ATPase